MKTPPRLSPLLARFPTAVLVCQTDGGKMLAPPPDSTPATADAYGGVAGGGTYDGTKEHCIDVDWRAAYTWSARQYRRGYSGPTRGWAASSSRAAPRAHRPLSV
jgi:hypothetical protein